MDLSKRLSTITEYSESIDSMGDLMEFDKFKHEDFDYDPLEIPGDRQASDSIEAGHDITYFLVDNSPVAKFCRSAKWAYEKLPVGGSGAVLVLSELENMAARQQREIAQQKRLLEQREARLAVLRGAQEPAQQDRLARLRHRLDQQQSKLNRLRLLRSQTDQSRANNATLTSDLDCIRALFNEKEKELSLAVAKVEELTRQLEELRGRHNNGGEHLSTPASAELEKLRRELMYRNKMNEQQNQVVSQQRLALVQRQAEMASIDARIAQLQGRLQRKRALNQRLSQQLGSNHRVNSNHPNFADSKLEFNTSKPRPTGNIAAIEPYSHIPSDDFSLNKNDPKYQTLPYNTKFAVNFKTDDDLNKNKIQHSASASQIGQRSYQQFGHQIAHSQSQSHIQGQSQPLVSSTINPAPAALIFAQATSNTNNNKHPSSIAAATATANSDENCTNSNSGNAHNHHKSGRNNNNNNNDDIDDDDDDVDDKTADDGNANEENDDVSNDEKMITIAGTAATTTGSATTATNTYNNSKNFMNNNNNGVGHGFGEFQNLRIHGQPQNSNNQKQYSGNGSSGINLVSSVGQSIAQIHNHRSLTSHQKPVSSVAPSFPVKSPIYQSCSTKIHPVMPQTLSLISHGQSPSAPAYSPNSQGSHAQDQYNYNGGQRNNFPGVNQLHMAQSSGISGSLYGNHSQNTNSNHSPNGLNLSQSSANIQTNYPGHAFAQSQSQTQSQIQSQSQSQSEGQSQNQSQSQSQTQSNCQQNPLLLNTNSSTDSHNDKVMKFDCVVKITDQSTLKYDNSQSKFDQQNQSMKFYEQPPRHDQTHGKYDHAQLKQDQQLKFDHSSKYNDHSQVMAKYEQIQPHFDNTGQVMLQNSKCDHHGIKYDYTTKFDSLVAKLPEKPFEYDRIKYDSDRKLINFESRGEDKTKPALPPKPNKPHPPPRLIHHEKIEVNSEVADGTALVIVGTRSDKDEDIPPIPTSEPPESPTEGSGHQIIKARPLTLKKAPLSEQPKLRYLKSNVHVSINRRIEMPPAFLFPETEIPADLMQSDQSEITENSIKRKLETDHEHQNNEKLTGECDIVDALNVLNIDETQLIHGVADNFTSNGTNNNKVDTVDRGWAVADQLQDCTKVDVIRRRKGNLKSTTGKANISRRVSFDPLALLLDASLEGELELVKKTAKEVANPSSANDEGITALHNAICAGHLEIVKFLVEFGCDVNAQDSDGWTPLHCAASCNNLSMVRFLVEHGACIFATTLSDHETAAEKCEEDEEGFDGCSEYLYSVQEKLGIINNGQVFAVFDYEAQHSDELPLRNGDSLVVLRKGDDNEREWWWSNLGHREGYVPRNLLGLYARVQPGKTD